MDVILCLSEHLSVCGTKESTVGSLAHRHHLCVCVCVLLKLWRMAEHRLDLNDDVFHSNLFST